MWRIAVDLPSRLAGARARHFAKVADACWLEVAMEHRWVEIQAVGPGDRPALGINPPLGEVLRVVERRKDRSTVRSGYKLELADEPIVEGEPHHMGARYLSLLDVGNPVIRLHGNVL